MATVVLMLLWRLRTGTLRQRRPSTTKRIARTTQTGSSRTPPTLATTAFPLPCQWTTTRTTTTTCEVCAPPRRWNEFTETLPHSSTLRLSVRRSVGRWLRRMDAAILCLSVYVCVAVALVWVVLSVVLRVLSVLSVRARADLLFLLSFGGVGADSRACHVSLKVST